MPEPQAKPVTEGEGTPLRARQRPVGVGPDIKLIYKINKGP